MLVFEDEDIPKLIQTSSAIEYSNEKIDTKLFAENDRIRKITGQTDIDLCGLEEEIETFYKGFPEIQQHFTITKRVGEVYMAIDLRNIVYDNSSWNLSEDGETRLYNKDTDVISYVALKRIYVTSAPHRILSEISMLGMFRFSDLLWTYTRHDNVACLINAMRHNDQVVVVLPFFEHHDFRSYYKHMSARDTCKYMQDLLSACDYIHSLGVIHRDIKPTNFLWNMHSCRGILVDFGLSQGPDLALKQKYKQATVVNVQKKLPKKGGSFENDQRSAVRANRAGTRGFRAPEVLFKVAKQTTGVTLLCILTGKFPFFGSNEDHEALSEIAHIWGRRAMRDIAHTFSTSHVRSLTVDRSFETNLPSINEPVQLETIIEKFRGKHSLEIPQVTMTVLRGLLTLDPCLRMPPKDAVYLLKEWASLDDEDGYTSFDESS